MDKKMLYVILPCYNEEENIENIIMQWKRQERDLNKRYFDLKLIVVNDGSRDNTFVLAKDLESTIDNIKVLNHKINMGLGETLNTGINYVMGEKKDGLICIMDGDSTHEPQYIFSMIDKLSEDNLDCVIASRFKIGSRVEGLSIFRKLLSFGARIVYTLSLRIPGVRDYTCGYRLYKIRALQSLHDRYKGQIVEEKSFACMMELLFKLYREGFKIGEIPFVLKYQLKGGRSKMRIFKTVLRSLIMLWKL